MERKIEDISRQAEELTPEQALETRGGNVNKSSPDLMLARQAGGLDDASPLDAEACVK